MKLRIFLKNDIPLYQGNVFRYQKLVNCFIYLQMLKCLEILLFNEMNINININFYIASFKLINQQQTKKTIFLMPKIRF